MNKLLFLLAAVLLSLAGCGGGAISFAPITLNPASASMLRNGTFQFTVNQNTLVDWSAPDGGTVVNGLFSAPNANGTYHVVATSIMNPTVIASATVTVADVQVVVSPAQISVAKSSVNTNALTAFVTGSPNKAVTWTVDTAQAGSVGAGTPDGSGNARGTFTAGTVPGVYSVRATSQADPTVSSIATVNVLGASALALSPTSATVSTTVPRNSVDLAALLTTATGAVDTTTALTWDMPVNPVGASLTGAGLRVRTFTAPTNFVGVANCQVRVRTAQGIAVIATIHVVSGP